MACNHLVRVTNGNRQGVNVDTEHQPKPCMYVKFCPFFSVNFNIMSGSSSTNRSTDCKKSILARVVSDVKRG